MSEALTMNEFHVLLFDMLTEFHEFCEKNDLKYYMIGGTLLGAVRFENFIPWDDDVDLAMPREDYERLAQIYEGSLSLHTYKNDRDHMFPYTKLFSKKSPLVRVKDEKFNIDGQCFAQIDLYPIDGLGDDREKAIAQLAAVKKQKRLLFLNLTTEKSKNPIKRVLLFFIRRMSPRRIIRRIDKKMQKHTVKASRYLTRWREGGVSPNAVPREVFGDPILIPFADKHFCAPADAHTYLTLVYGDYTVDKRCDEGLRHATTRNNIAEKMAEDLTKKQ